MSARHAVAKIGLVDSGNSRLHFGVWDGVEVIGQQAHPYPETEAALRCLIISFIERNRITSVAACSVSKRWRDSVFSILNKACDDLRVARTVSDVGVTVPYDHPENYGIDRALGVLRAFDICGGACVVIDAGSAVTVDAVDNRGNVAGGYICPGPYTMMAGLAERTALPVVNPVQYGEGIGVDTETSIGHGIGLGYAGAVERLVEFAISQIGDTEKIYITGGDGEYLRSLLRMPSIYRPSLVLEGLALAFPMLPSSY